MCVVAQCSYACYLEQDGILVMQYVLSERRIVEIPTGQALGIHTCVVLVQYVGADQKCESLVESYRAGTCYSVMRFFRRDVRQHGAQCPNVRGGFVYAWDTTGPNRLSANGTVD